MLKNALKIIAGATWHKENSPDYETTDVVVVGEKEPYDIVILEVDEPVFFHADEEGQVYYYDCEGNKCYEMLNRIERAVIPKYILQKAIKRN